MNWTSKYWQINDRCHSSIPILISRSASIIFRLGCIIKALEYTRASGPLFWNSKGSGPESSSPLGTRFETSFSGSAASTVAPDVDREITCGWARSNLFPHIIETKHTQRLRHNVISKNLCYDIHAILETIHRNQCSYELRKLRKYQRYQHNKANVFANHDTYYNPDEVQNPIQT